MSEPAISVVNDLEEDLIDLTSPPLSPQPIDPVAAVAEYNSKRWDCRDKNQDDEAAIQETLAALPTILVRQGSDSMTFGRKLTMSMVYWSDATVFWLPPPRCPSLQRHARISVTSMDPLQASQNIDIFHPFPVPESHNSCSLTCKRPVILTLDSASCQRDHSNFDFLHASTFQHESLLIRTSLGLATQECRVEANQPQCTQRPLSQAIALYHRDVIVVRSTRSRGHYWLTDHIKDYYLPLISVVTMRDPLLCTVFQTTRRPDGTEKAVFPDDDYRNKVKNRMRMSLRIAVRYRHHDVVLCGLGNPKRGRPNPMEEVAHCWLEVLREPEFNAEVNGGSWFRTVVLAVCDPDLENPMPEGWFEAFSRILDGKLV